MKHIKPNAMEQLLQPLPETTQEVIRGGSSDYTGSGFDRGHMSVGVASGAESGSGTLIPVIIKHNA